MCICACVCLCVCIVVQSCLTLCHPMDCSSPGFPVHQQLLELVQLMSIELVMLSNHLILYCPLFLLPSIFSSIKGLFQWVGSSHQVAKVLGCQLQHQSFQWIFRLISFRFDWLDHLQSKGLSRVFSNTTVQKHQFFSTQLSSQSNSHTHTWPLEKP